ncbi:MAG TPA: SDR family oxidoreductase [Pseudonocardiaceae bacterium]
MVDHAVIAGAAGALGRALVTEFHSRGWSVIAMDRPGTALDELFAVPGVTPVPTDLTDRGSVQAAWQRVDEVGRPRVLVNTVGAFAGGTLDELDEDTLDGMLGSNLAAVLWSCQAAARRMAEQGGVIVNVGSRTGVRGEGPVAYAAAKAGVVRLTEVLADELRPSGIRVNAVLPSVIDTPANRTWMPEDLAQRAVPPEAIARVISFLCSDDAWPISGAIVPVYGEA